MNLKRGVCLSRTELNGQFCFNIYDFFRGRQIRPLRSGDRTEKKFDVSQDNSRYLCQNIHPGTILEYDTSYIHPRPNRPTHPEDALVDFSSMKIIGTIADDEYQRIVDQLTFPSFKDLYPTAQTQNGKAFALQGEKLKQSVGYIHAQSVIVSKNDRDISCIVTTTDNIRLNLKLKDLEQLTHFFHTAENKSQRFSNVRIRLSLATPYNPNDIWPVARCYVQLSRIEGITI